jgi:hypothetical protein
MDEPSAGAGLGVSQGLSARIPQRWIPVLQIEYAQNKRLFDLLDGFVPNAI